MAISLSLLDSGTPAGGFLYNTASVTPTGVVFIVIGGYEQSTSQPTVSSVSGCGLTWTLVLAQDCDRTGSDRSTLEVWKGLGTASAGAITVSYVSFVGYPTYQVIDVTGADTTTPVVQSAGFIGGSGDTSTSVTLSAFADATNNVAFFATNVQNNGTNTCTPEAGYTEVSEVVNSYCHIASEWKIGEDTSPTYTFTGTNYRSGSIGIEIAAASGPAAQTITCNVLNATSTLFNPTIINSQIVTCNVLNATSTLFNPTIVNTQIIACNLLTAPSTIYNPTIIPPASTLELQLITAPTTLYDAGLEQLIVLGVVNSTTTLFNPSTTSDINLNVLTTFTNLFTPELVQRLGLQVLDTPSTLYAPTLTQDVSLDVINTTANVLNPDVPAPGAQTLALDFISDITTLFAPTTDYNVTVPVLNTASTLLAPDLAYNIGMQTITTGSTVFTPTLEYLIQMQTVNTAPTIHPPFVGEPPPDTFSGAIVKTHNPSPFPIGL